MKTADPELMRAINRFHVLDAIRAHGPISRIEISARTDLSPTTVSAITAALLDDNLITPRQIVSLGEGSRGRPRVMLELNAKAAHVVGVKLAAHQISIVTTNFQADPLTSLTMPVRTIRQPVDVIADIIEDGVRRCVADADLGMDRISGVCIGLPGIVEHDGGICRESAILSEADVALSAAMKQRLKVEVALESDVNLVTLAEHWFGHGRGQSNFMVVTADHDLGVGLMHQGALVRGAQGLSGAFGEIVLDHGGGNGAALMPRRLKDVAAEDALIKKAVKALPDCLSDDLIRAGRAMERLFELAGANDQRLAPIFGEAGRALGQGIANLIVMLAPPRLIISGSLLRAGRLFTDPLRAAVAGLLPSPLAKVSPLIFHDWGDEAWARGAAALLLRDLYGAPWNTSGPVQRSRMGGNT